MVLANEYNFLPLNFCYDLLILSTPYIMDNIFFGEKWKKVHFDFEYSNDYVLEISNYGRLRTHNKISKGKILNGSFIQGYRIVRLKFFTHRTPEFAKKISALQQDITQLKLQLKQARENNDEDQVVVIQKSIDTAKKKLQKKLNEDLKSRTIHYHSLIHRLVAEYFCRKPSKEHSIVGHIDHNKLNNNSNNLKWMTPEENYIHQQNSPHVISRKNEEAHIKSTSSKANKLTITKVMLLKKLLNEGKPIRTLVKTFKITDTQILRIKKGENWKYVEAAK